MKLNKISIALLGIYLVSSCGHHADEATIAEHKKHQITAHHGHDEHTEDHHEEKDGHDHEAEKSLPVSMLGESSYFVIGSPDYDRTVEFYSILGWQTEETGEEPWKWTVMSDGSTELMINEDTMSYFAPAYYSAHTEEVYARMDGYKVPMYMNYPNEDGSDMFRVYDLPDSVSILISNEAKDREMHNLGDLWLDPMSGKLMFPNPVSGTFQEYALSVENLESSVAYWEKLGFETHGINEGPYRYAIMYDGELVVGLHENNGMWNGSLLTYSGHSAQKNKEALDKLKSAGFAKDVETVEYEGMELPGNYLIPDPSGNVLFLSTTFSEMNQ